MYGQSTATAKGEPMNQSEWYDYDSEGDVLDVHFVPQPRPAWTIELTPNIMVSIDRQTQQAIGLTFLDYAELVSPTLWGQRSFPIIGLANLPLAEQEMLFLLLNNQPINKWLDVSVVENLPDSPFTVAHLHPPPETLRHLLPLELA